MTLKNFIEKRIDADLAQKKYEKVVTRFPPEPNGYLHLGHAKAIFLNFGLAKKYAGACHLRFDDTNPAKEEQCYVENIQKDLNWLGVQWDRLCYASDYFEQFYAAALQLIHKGLAYVDHLSGDEIRTYRGTLTEAGKNSPYRDQSISDNLKQFEAMRCGHYADGEAVLRAKIDMASPNLVLRDPVLYRIKRVEHHQTGDQWIIYPMYDFAHCLSDAFEGISHSICTLEFQDNRALYDWILDQLEISPRPYQHEFARLNIENTILSKRLLSQLVEEKRVEGWDDPRMPTLSGCRRRGYPAQALKLFSDRLGISKQNSTVEEGALISAVRQVLDDSAPRNSAILDPLSVTITNLEDDRTYQVEPLRHPKNPDLGKRAVILGKHLYIEREDFRLESLPGYKRWVLGSTVRLRYGWVLKAIEVEKDGSGRVIRVLAVADLDSLGGQPSCLGKPAGIIHWLNQSHAERAEFRLYQSLFTSDPSTEESSDGSETGTPRFNENSLQIKHGWVSAERDYRAADGECVTQQFERLGYFKEDEPLGQVLGHRVFHQTLSLKQTYELAA